MKTPRQIMMVMTCPTRVEAAVAIAVSTIRAPREAMLALITSGLMLSASGASFHSASKGSAAR
jgi:hypothetical protein